MPDPTSPFFESHFSLLPLVDYWRTVASNEQAPLAALAEELLQRYDATPALQGRINDVGVLKEHTDLIDAMMTAVFPHGLRERTKAAIYVPLDMRPAYATPSFERFFESSTLLGHTNFDPQMMEQARTMRAYHTILSEVYGVETTFHMPLLFTTRDTRTNLDSYYRVNIDPSFCATITNGPPPELSEGTIRRLTSAPLNVSLWQEHLPPERFTLEGFIVLTAINVTDQQVLSMLRHDLLQKDAMATPQRIDHLQNRLRTLIQCPELRLGLISLERNEVNAIHRARAVGRSLLLDAGCAPDCPHRHESSYAHLFETMEPVVVSDLEQSTHDTGYEAYLRTKGFRSLLLAPLVYEDRPIGVLEVASPAQGVLNELSTLKLQEVIALFATALQRTLDEQEDRLQAVIKRQYTALHPVVEWRFREAARSYVEQQAEGSRPKLDAIVFRGVYPLYGLTDVRGSSEHRNDAIRDDLLEQLGLALSVIVEASIHRPLPAIDEIGYRVERYVEELQTELNSEHEITVLDFLRRDVEPLFDHLAVFNPGVRRRIDAYWDALDADLGILYRHRRDFDESIQRINDTIGAYLDEQQETAQAMFPHYFEKYKTDGVDYNIYIGDALVESDGFDPLYLRNLRLWQLMAHCGIAWELDRLRPSLAIPLATTHLILVQHLPLSIRFRLEEKKFDVDGAYNIRYEIVKKRIDKAVVRGTGERLTQPGKIAIVYSQPREVKEYRRYVEYLQAAGYLTDEVEDLELQDLQGAHGLKALRVTVAPPEDTPQHGLAQSRILTSIASLPVPLDVE